MHKILNIIIAAAILSSLFPLSPVFAERLVEGPNFHESINDIFVFARAGENVLIELRRATTLPATCATSSEIINYPQAIVNGPNNFAYSSIVSSTQLQSSTTEIDYFVAPTEGIYKIAYSTLAFSSDADTASICPSVPFAHGSSSYIPYTDHQLYAGGSVDISVTGDSGYVIKGRVFANEWRMYSSDYATYEFHAVRDDGYRYQVTQDEFHGAWFITFADAFGATAKGEEDLCISGYASYGDETAPGFTDVDSVGKFVNPECGGRYRIYANSPDPTMPTTTTNWDDTQTWLLPNDPERPQLISRSYENTSTDTYEGTLSITVSNYYGNAFLLVDTDGNGSYDDPTDRRIQFGITKNGVGRISFDGKDSSGDAIPLTQTIKMAIELNAVGEIHFVNADIEWRRNIEVIRLNGTTSDRDIIFWNDSLFQSTRNTPFTANVNGTFDHSLLGIHSATSDDVHGWCPTPTLPCTDTGADRTYGDGRMIDDWTYDAPMTTALRTEFISETEFIVPTPYIPPSVPNTGIWAELSSAIFERHLWTLIFVPIAIVAGYTIYKHMHKANTISLSRKNSRDKK